MQEITQRAGIEGHLAPELQVDQWVDANGEATKAVKLEDFEGKFKVIYCFQAWCPGCHSQGLPALQEMVAALEGNDKVVFMAIQTVFEGKEENTFERMLEIQKEFELAIPFGHDEGNPATENISGMIDAYRTGGTPWFIFINQQGKVVFNDFHLNVENAITYLKEVE